MALLVSAACALLLLLSICWLYHLLDIFVLCRLRKEPPLFSGFVPFVGAAIELGKGPPLDFIERCWRRAGPLFTIHAAGRRLTFLFDPTHFPLYFESEETEVSFQTATQPFLSRGFGVPKESYFEHHLPILAAVRSHLSPLALQKHLTSKLYERISRAVDVHLPAAGGRIELLTSLRSILFSATFELFFGESVKVDAKFLADFETFDGLFEIASASVPHFLLRPFTGARARLHARLSRVISGLAAASETMTEEQRLLAEVVYGGTSGGAAEGPSWLLAILWAAEANSIPAAFWTLVHLLTHADYLRDLRRQLDDTFGQGPIGHSELSNLTALRNAVHESIRLIGAPIIVRQAPRTLRVGDFNVRAGDFVCLSPFWSHRDAQLFDAPDEWQPQRWSQPNNSQHKYWNLSFGSGKYRCPGMHFALVEIAMIVAVLLQRFDVVDESIQAPELHKRNLVGLVKPAADLRITLVPRQRR